MEYPQEYVLYAFGLTLLAGLATGIGSVIAFFARRTDYRMLSYGLGFSAGAMLYVSFTEILNKADDALTEAYGSATGGWLTALSFFAGVLLILLIDKIIPSAENPHEPREKTDIRLLKPDAVGGAPADGASHDRRRAAVAVRTGHSHDDGANGEPEPGSASGYAADARAAGGPPLMPGAQKGLMRTALLAGVAITAHNFPEGMVTFLSTLDDPSVGLMIAIAIALHNIPEGLSIAVPLYFATGSRKKAFTLSLLSGLAEPIGATIGFLLLRSVLTQAVMGMLFGAIAGIMVFISIDGLLPASRKYGQGHQTVYGTIAGMAVMAASLVLFR